MNTIEGDFATDRVTVVFANPQVLKEFLDLLNDAGVVKDGQRYRFDAYSEGRGLASITVTTDNLVGAAS